MGGESRREHAQARLVWKISAGVKGHLPYLLLLHRSSCGSRLHVATAVSCRLFFLSFLRFVRFFVDKGKRFFSYYQEIFVSIRAFYSFGSLFYFCEISFFFFALPCLALPCRLRSFIFYFTFKNFTQIILIQIFLEHPNTNIPLILLKNFIPRTKCTNYTNFKLILIFFSQDQEPQLRIIILRLLSPPLPPPVSFKFLKFKCNNASGEDFRILGRICLGALDSHGDPYGFFCSPPPPLSLPPPREKNEKENARTHVPTVLRP